MGIIIIITIIALFATGITTIGFAANSRGCFGAEKPGPTTRLFFAPEDARAAGNSH
jgi:hypothetical protein